MGNSADTPSRNDEYPYCLEHAKEDAKLFCGTCKELACIQCIMKSNKHYDHECTLAFVKHKEEVMSSMEPMEM